MYQNLNGITYINGSKGIYDGKINNNSVKYARNAVNNYMQTYSHDTFEKIINSKDMDVSELPSDKFSMKYAENKAGKPDTLAVLGAAYEELGKRESVTVDELTKTLQDALEPEHKQLASAASLDINNDGKIDLAEYGTSILVEDMLSSDSKVLKAENITGEINDSGQTNLLAFANKNNYDSAHETYKDVYNAFQLNAAQEEFLKDKNNLIG